MKATPAQFEAPTEWKSSLSQMTSAYLSIERGLVRSDLDSARASWPKLKEAVEAASKLDSAGLGNAQAAAQWSKILTELKSASMGFDQAKDDAAFRAAFVLFSGPLVEVISLFGHDGKVTLYVVQGAGSDDSPITWVQTQFTPQNPFGGAAESQGKAKVITLLGANHTNG